MQGHHQCSSHENWEWNWSGGGHSRSRTCTCFCSHTRTAHRSCLEFPGVTVEPQPTSLTASSPSPTRSCAYLGVDPLSPATTADASDGGWTVTPPNRNRALRCPHIIFSSRQGQTSEDCPSTQVDHQAIQVTVGKLQSSCDHCRLLGRSALQLANTLTAVEGSLRQAIQCSPPLEEQVRQWQLQCLQSEYARVYSSWQPEPEQQPPQVARLETPVAQPVPPCLPKKAVNPFPGGAPIKARVRKMRAAMCRTPGLSSSNMFIVLVSLDLAQVATG